MISPIRNFFENHFQSRYKKLYKRARALFVFDMVLLAMIGAVLIGTVLFFIFREPPSLLVITSQSSTSEIRAGEPVTIIATLSNPSEVALTAIEISLQPPDEIVVSHETGQAITVADLEAGASIDIPLRVTFWGEVDTTLRLPLRSSARTPEHEIDIAHGVIIRTIEQPAVTISFNNIPTLYEGQFFAPEITLTQKIERGISDLRIRVERFDGLLHSPYFSEDGVLPVFEPDTDLLLNSTQEKIVSDHVNLEYVVEYQISGEVTAVLTRGILSEEVQQLDVSFSTSVNTADRIISEAARVPVSVVVQNNIPDVLEFVGFNFSSPSACVRFENRMRNPDSSRIPLLDFASRGSITPGEFRGDLWLSMRVVCEPAGGNITINPTMSFSIGDSNHHIELGAESFALTAKGTSSLQAQSRYFTEDGDQLGRGPLPPEAGKTTKVWVFVEMGNRLGTLLKPEFSAELADYVHWTGRSNVTAGKAINFNSQKNLVSWKHDEIRHGERATLGFELSITPPEDGLYKLLTHISLSGRDRATGEAISLSVPTVVTPHE